MTTLRHRGALVLTLAALVTPARADSLAVDPADPRLQARPDLRAVIEGSAHGYFRFINAPFAREACELFADVRASLPEVNLHGDAHIEQYAVTSLGRGLTDFDDCTNGAPVIDLVRFGVSLALTAREKGWALEETRFLDEFLRGYRAALRNPQLFLPMPQLATRVRGRFAFDHAAALRAADRLIDADPRPLERFQELEARFAALIRARRPELAEGFCVLKRAGGLSIGVGSALDEKYLLRFEGPSPSPEDDVVVEAKRIRDLPANPCTRPDIGASRVLTGQQMIAYEPFQFSAVVPHDGRYFWVHGWTDDYREASITDVILTPRDLRELAYDAGVQLGRAHPKGPDGRSSSARRREVLQACERLEPRLRRAIADLTARTESAWRAFRAAGPG